MAKKNGDNNQPPRTGNKTPFRESINTDRKGNFIRDDTAPNGGSGTTNSSGPRKTPDEKK